MKKACLFILSVFILAHASCSLLDNERTTSFSINVDDAFISQIRNSSRAANYPASENFTVVITLSGGTNQQKTVNMTWMDLEAHPNADSPDRQKNNTVTFDKIPLNVPFDILAEFYCGRELFYEASKKGVVLSSRGTTDLTMILKELLNTQYVFYTPASADTNYFYSYERIDSLPPQGVIPFNSPDFFDFCFTNHGDVIYSNGTQIKEEFDSIEISGSNYSSGENVFLAFDYKNNILYSSSQGVMQKSYDQSYAFLSSIRLNKFMEGSDGTRYFTNDLELCSPGHLISTNDTDIGLYGNLTIQAFAAWDDNVFYGVKAYNSLEDTCDFLILQYLVTPPSVEDSMNGNFELNYQGFVKFPDYARDSASITDMICLDGYCYLLIKETNKETDEKSHTVSRGLIAKINCNTLSVKTSGLASVKTTPAGTINTAWQNVLGMLITTDYNASHYYTAPFNNTTPYVYAGPSANEKQNCFFGPDKFIAIKPKKLVVSDTGAYIWTNRDGVFAKKNINRVVYVDLDSLSITDTVDIDKEAVQFSETYPVAAYDTTLSQTFDWHGYYYYYISDLIEHQQIDDSQSTIQISPTFAID